MGSEFSRKHLIRRYLFGKPAQIIVDSAGILKRLWPTMLELHRIVWGVSLLLITFCAGTLAYMAYGWHFSDAVFMVLISVTTVGYGEIQPVKTPGLRLVTSLTILSGLVGNALLVSAIAEVLISRSLRKALGRKSLDNMINAMANHVVIVGYGKMGRQSVERLRKSNLEIVVIENNPETVAELESLGVPHVQGDGMNEAMLIAAGIERARYVLCLLSNDVDNVFVTLSARQLSPRVRIISKADHQSSLRKLYQAGANHVVSPSAMGSMRVASLVVNPLFVELTEAIYTGIGDTQLEVHELPLDELPEVLEMSFQQLQIQMLGIKSVVLGLRHATGRVNVPPPLDHRFSRGESLIILGKSEDILFCSAEIRKRLLGNN